MVTADAAHDLLKALLPQDARIIYNFHKAPLRHGQRIDIFECPRCDRYPIIDMRDYDKTVFFLHFSNPYPLVFLVPRVYIL